MNCNSDHSNLFSYASHVVRNIYKTGRSLTPLSLALCSGPVPVPPAAGPSG